jgi:antirestriction protein ArdC
MAKQTPDQIRTDITQDIIEGIKGGSMPWRKPWNNAINSGAPANYQSKRRYTSINALILMLTSMQKNYNSRFWGSSSSMLKNIGAHVKKGEKATFVTFFKMLAQKNDEGAVMKTASGKDKVIPLMKIYPVFSVEQLQPPTVESLLDGRGAYGIVKSLLGQFDKTNRKSVTSVEELRQIAKKYLPARNQPKEGSSREEIATSICEGIQANLNEYLSREVVSNEDPDFEPAEKLLALSGAKIVHGGDRACYVHGTDTIHMPNKTSFLSITEYYQTAFHELAHWTQTGRVERTNKFETKEESYAFEELVAEISSCFILTEIGVPLAEQMLPNTKSYVAVWISKMQNDPKYIFSAATQASKIVDYILAFVGKQNPAFEEAESEDE